MPIRFRTLILISAALLLLGGVLVWAGPASASRTWQSPPLSTQTYDRPIPLPTVYPPSQSDTGAQVYWGMCQDCHGDQGQGLAAEWRAAYAPYYENCWAAGCHGEDAPSNSFTIPEAGAPALAGPGALPQFSTAFELGTYIQKSMPLFPTDSLTEDQAWELTAYLLSCNDAGDPSLTLNGTNSAAIPVHSQIHPPGQSLPGALLLGLCLIIGAVGYSAGSKYLRAKTGKGNFYHHLHPATIPADQARISYTLGAGGLAVFFCLVLLITGLLETYYYLPDPGGAAESIQTLSTLVPYGDLVRNTHFWSAQLLVLVNERDTRFGETLPYQLLAVAHHHGQVIDFGPAHGRDDKEQHGHTGDLVQNLGQFGFHPYALPCRENHTDQFAHAHQVDSSSGRSHPPRTCPKALQKHLFSKLGRGCQAETPVTYARDMTGGRLAIRQGKAK